MKHSIKEETKYVTPSKSNSILNPHTSKIIAAIIGVLTVINLPIVRFIVIASVKSSLGMIDGNIVENAGAKKLHIQKRR